MNEILFGKDHHLADTFNVFADESKEVYENDTACIDALLENLDSTEGNVFLVFLDSTHFDYSWLQEESLISAPGKIDYLSVACAEGIDGVKDRYRNAVHFIDGLMGRVFEKVSNESIVVVTGDHGEEFLEQGNIFHASNLSSMQTRVPIYCRLGTPMRQELASHIDIFPTILHRVIGKDLFASWFDGESLLRPRERNFVVSSRYNASRTPFEFLIHDGKHQLVARFNNQRDVSKAHALHLISLRDEHNMPVDIDATRVEHDFKPALEILFRSEE